VQAESKRNRNLLVLTLILMTLSIWAYRESVERADRFQRGQVFLSNLNPDEIARIEVRQGEQAVTLERQGETFRVLERQGYPANNAAVNRLVADLLEVGLEKEIGTGAELEQELEIEPLGESTLEVVIQDAAEKEMVRMRLGKAFEGGSGRYVQRLDRPGDPIYLTSGGVHVSVDPGSYLQKQIVDVPASELIRIEGPDVTLAREVAGADWSLAGTAGPTDLDEVEVNRLGSALSGLRFESVYLADDEEVRDLDFGPALGFDLEDGSGYDLSLVERQGRYFLRIAGRHSVSQVAISMDEAEEDLQEKAELLTRADEIEDFNRFHGSWIYELGEPVAKKLLLRRADLVETGSI
jgi:hypothetical protein